MYMRKSLIRFLCLLFLLFKLLLRLYKLFSGIIKCSFRNLKPFFEFPLLVFQRLQALSRIVRCALPALREPDRFFLQRAFFLFCLLDFGLQLFFPAAQNEGALKFIPEF